MKKIAFKTLGCRLNQYETDAIASTFSAHQFRVVDFKNQADVYVLNTCTVTNQSDSKSMQALNQIERRANNPVVVVTGCMVNSQREKLQQLHPGVTYFIDNEQKSHIFDILNSHFNGEIQSPESLETDKFGFAPAKDTFHTRSFIKIQDGCDNFCTYCIVPRVRGRAISRPVNDILENIRQVIDYGFKEIVLTGVNISRYEHENFNFEGLIEKILELDGDFRVRISSIEADGFTEKLNDLFKHPKLTPHLHLCLQSGSDAILSKMRRFYTVDSFRNIVNNIRIRIPDFNFTTDIIVGFPGESKQDFSQTLDVVREIGFSHIHTFKYSIRDKTRAARMEDQVPERIKTARSKIVRDLSDELKLNYRQSFVGKEQMVLIEKIDEKGMASGYGQHYFPVKFKAHNVEKNSFVKVRLESIEQAEDPIVMGTAI